MTEAEAGPAFHAVQVASHVALRQLAMRARIAVVSNHSPEQRPLAFHAGCRRDAPPGC